MPRRAAAAVLLVLAVFLPSPLRAQQAAPVALGDSIGPEIDPAERDAYGLFPDLDGFQSARLLPRGAGYRLEYTARDGARAERTRTRRVSKDAFELTRWHVELSDVFRAEEHAPGVDTLREAGWLRRLALRYASDRRYDAGVVLVRDLRGRFPATAEGAWAERNAPRFEALSHDRKALIWPGALVDQRGRTDLLIFTGYYSLWLGIAIPASLEAEGEGAYAAGMMLLPAGAVLATSAATRDARITKGMASVISLGGLLGTWQGLGWAGMSDAEGVDVVRAGVLAGLGGVAVAVPIANASDITEGHGQILHSSMFWGAWYGAVVGVLANHDDTQDNGVLSDMLIGSDAAVAVTAIAAKGAQLSENRMRLINLCGVLGGVFGTGAAILGPEDMEEESIMALIGGGTAAGLLLGVRATREYDRGKDLASRHPAQEPEVAGAEPGGPTVRFGAVTPRAAVPGARPGPPRLGIRVTF